MVFVVQSTEPVVVIMQAACAFGGIDARPMIVAASIISDKRTLCIAAFAVASRTPALHTGNFPTKRDHFQGALKASVTVRNSH